jgi:putative flippase GtrA
VTGATRTGTGPVARRFLTYLVVGVAGFAVDFGLLVLFREVVGTPVWLATTIAFWGSLAVVFLSNKYLTFGAQGAGHRQLARYFVLLGVNYLATLGVVHLAEQIGLGYQLGKVAAVAMTTVWNFVAYQLWVFRPSARADTDTDTTTTDTT